MQLVVVQLGMQHAGCQNMQNFCRKSKADVTQKASFCLSNCIFMMVGDVGVLENATGQHKDSI